MFIGQKSIGGASDVAALDATDDLRKILVRACEHHAHYLFACVCPCFGRWTFSIHSTTHSTTHFPNIGIRLLQYVSENFLMWCSFLVFPGGGFHVHYCEADVWQVPFSVVCFSCDAVLCLGCNQGSVNPAKDVILDGELTGRKCEKIVSKCSIIRSNRENVMFSSLDGDLVYIGRRDETHCNSMQHMGVGLH